MLNKSFLKKVAAFIAEKGLLRQDAKHIVALSGGADSITLALALQQLNFDIEAAHCNFHLREKESDRDEDFCKTFCKEHGLKLHIAHFDTTAFAKLHKISIEMAARRLRYSYFEQLRKDTNADSICVAHHKDDTVETVLMNLIRGTGIHGLTGIAAQNGHIVRPLLCVFRNEIEETLRQAHQPYVTDSTNLEDDVVRNKIRLNLIPLMRTINPAVSESIATTAERMADAAKVFDAAIESATANVAEWHADGTLLISIDRLNDETAPEYVLFTLLKDYGFTPAQTEQIFHSLRSESGRTFTSASHQLLIDRKELIIEKLETTHQRPIKIPEVGLYSYGLGTKLRFEILNADGFKVDKTPSCACLDAAIITFPLTVRRVMQGDRFTPFGMQGSKLISDYLTDHKKTLFEKRRQSVVLDASEKIIWLVNERPDNRFRITNNTQQVLRITLVNQNA